MIMQTLGDVPETVQSFLPTRLFGRGLADLADPCSAASGILNITYYQLSTATRLRKF